MAQKPFFTYDFATYNMVNGSVPFACGPIKKAVVNGYNLKTHTPKTKKTTSMYEYDYVVALQKQVLKYIYLFHTEMEMERGVNWNI